MKYYKQIKAAFIVAFIVLICLWLYGCSRCTETDLPRSKRIKTAVSKDAKTITSDLSECYAQRR